jgi:hypothetical protein
MATRCSSSCLGSFSLTALSVFLAGSSSGIAWINSSSATLALAAVSSVAGRVSGSVRSLRVAALLHEIAHGTMINSTPKRNSGDMGWDKCRETDAVSDCFARLANEPKGLKEDSIRRYACSTSLGNRISNLQCLLLFRSLREKKRGSFRTMTPHNNGTHESAIRF